MLAFRAIIFIEEGVGLGLYVKCAIYLFFMVNEIAGFG
jgi:hypothetical protein